MSLVPATNWCGWNQLQWRWLTLESSMGAIHLGNESIHSADPCRISWVPEEHTASKKNVWALKTNPLPTLKFLDTCLVKRWESAASPWLLWCKWQKWLTHRIQFWVQALRNYQLLPPVSWDAPSWNPAAMLWWCPSYPVERPNQWDAVPGTCLLAKWVLQLKTRKPKWRNEGDSSWKQKSRESWEILVVRGIYRDDRHRYKHF